MAERSEVAEPAVVGLVLAAGAGRRFGRPKALVEIDGERLVDRAVRVLREGGVALSYVVAGAAALDVPVAPVLPNPDWDTGMASSLRVGLAGLPADAAAVVVVPVDQPGLTAAAVARVVAASGAGRARRRALVVATYDGVGGHPVLIGREHWATLAAEVTGDEGARRYLATRPQRVRRVECGDVGDGGDIDRPEDLAAGVRVTDMFPPGSRSRR